MTQAHIDMFLANGCLYCQKLLLSTCNCSCLDHSTTLMYTHLQKEVDLFEGAPLCSSCHTLLKRKAALLKRIDPQPKTRISKATKELQMESQLN